MQNVSLAKLGMRRAVDKDGSVFQKGDFRMLPISIVSIFCSYVRCNLVAMRKSCFSVQVMLAIILMSWTTPFAGGVRLCGKRARKQAG
jgi:hypothetical protein